MLRCLALLLFLTAGPSLATEPNLFADPGFEEGGAAWSRVRGSKETLGAEFVGDVVFAGERAAKLEIDTTERPRRFASASIAQVSEHSPFPARLRGRYYAAHWERPDGGPEPILQVVVGAVGDPRTNEILTKRFPEAKPPVTPFTNYGLHYQLAGAPEAASEEQAPETLPNVWEIAVRPGPPAAKEWVPFDLPIREDFQKIWGAVPEGYGHLKFLLQVVWLDRAATGKAKAVVYIDDLELVPAESAAP